MVIDLKNQVDDFNECDNTYNFGKTIKSDCRADSYPVLSTSVDNNKPSFSNNGDTLDVTLSIANDSDVPNPSTIEVASYLSKDKNLDTRAIGSDIKLGSKKFTRTIANANNQYNQLAEINFCKEL